MNQCSTFSNLRERKGQTFISESRYNTPACSTICRGKWCLLQIKNVNSLFSSFQAQFWWEKVKVLSSTQLMPLSAGVPFLSVPSEELTFESAKEIAVHCCFTIFLGGIIMARDMICANEEICHTPCVIIHSKWNQVMSCVELDWDSSKACMHGLHKHDYPFVTKFSMVILPSYNAWKHCPAIATWLICSFKYISVTSGGSFLEIWLFSLSQLTVFSFPMFLVIFWVSSENVRLNDYCWCLSTHRNYPKLIHSLYVMLVLFIHILSKKENNLANQ